MLLKEVQLNLLKEFLRVCEMLDLPCFAVQGTLLGAVRHGGTIPWDDDIDVGMLRKDYEVFLRKAPALLSDYCFLQTFHTDPVYYHCFAKLRDSRTTFIEKTSRKLKRMNQGIFIDIFPFDYYPENVFSALLFDFRKTVLRYRLRSQFYIPQDNEPGFTNMVKRAMMKGARILCPSETEALKRSEKLFTDVPPGRLLISNGSPWGKREIVELSWMRKTRPHIFEDIFIPIPTGSDAYLKHVYGSYMELPLVNERKPHHYAVVIDPDVPYGQWMKKLDKEE